MKRLAFLGGAAGLGLAALLATQGHAADHLDAPLTQANPMADINDVYAWTDGTNLNLVMTVSPADPGDRSFDPSVQYVIHVHSLTAFGEAPTAETRIICTFASNTDGSCWVTEGGTTKDFVTGDFSATSGVASASGDVRVFAGLRSDPFFFNLHGFRDAITTVKSVAGGLTFDAAGCPNNVTDAQAELLRTQLAMTPTTAQAPCPAGNADCFETFNVRAIVVQLDKSLVNEGANSLISVWASTHGAAGQ